MDAAIDTKLRAARTRLILDTPFLGALVLHLPLTPADPRRVPTVATDARAFYYNSAYIAGLSLPETQFVLAHEALHCALGHFVRRSHRVRRRWDVACDHAVNWLLVEEGLKPPSGALLDPAFRGLAAEEIYPLVPEDTREAPLDLHAFDGGGEAPDRLAAGATPGEASPEGAKGGGPSGDLALEAAAVGRLRAGAAALGAQALPAMGGEELAGLWRMRLAAAAQQALRAGRLHAGWQRLVDRFIEPRLPWRALLERFLRTCGRDDYSFQRPPRREGEAILPRLASRALEVVAVIDVSGSIGQEELTEFAAELNALKSQLPARVTLHACDERLAPEGPWVFEPWEALRLPPRMTGGGGTRFTPVFEWIERQDLCPDALIYFTDALGEFPERAPPYPVLWLVKGREPVPWGERVQLN
ncbi:vWA domain-containing protein [Pelomicrobium sp. G1]|uniref:vWA domain-containing protein n=1 Tax=unclassified Pelomicrobium TaxID=2815318 RepID=UPI003F775D6A